MATTTTMGVKLDEETRERLKKAASKIDRTPHWLIRQAIFNLLEAIESGQTPFFSELSGTGNEPDKTTEKNEPVQPFLDFAEQVLPQSVIRAAITAAWRRPETDAVPMILEQARLTPALSEKPISWHISSPKTFASKIQRRPCRDGSGAVAGVLFVFSGGCRTDVSR